MASYLGNIIRAIMGNTINVSRDLTDEEVREFLRHGGNSATSLSGRAINDTAAMKVAAANRCISIVSGVVSSLPLDLIKRISERERQPAVNHPLRRVLTVAPNPLQTPKQFKQLMQVWLLLRGNAYARIVRDARGEVMALLPMHPDRVRVVRTGGMEMEYVYTSEDGRQITYNRKDVFHLVGMSLDGFTGLSVISFMKESLSIALDGEAAASTLMKNGSFVDAVIEHPAKMSPDSYKRLVDSWAERRTGVENAGKTAILEEGAKLSKLSMTASDLQFMAQRDFQRYDIAMFFGVPPHMIGATEKTTSWGSGIEQLNIGFVQYTLNDWFVTWQETIKRDLMTERDRENHDARFFPQALLKGDLKAQWDAFTRGRQWGIYSANDVREMLDMNPREDAEGDEYALPPNETKDVQGEGPDIGHNNPPKDDENAQ